VPQRSADDLLLLTTGNNKLYNTGGAQLSAEDLRLSSQSSAFGSFDIGALMAGTADQSGSPFEENLTQTTSADMLASSMTWYDTSLPAVAEGNEDLSLMPSTSITGMSDWEWNNIPSATTEYFSPSDLPLVSDPSQAADYAQPISHSGESNYQSAPGLTASSSGAQSEAGFPMESQPNDVMNGYWNDTVVFRPQSYDSQADIGNGFSFPIANMETPSIGGQRKSQSPIDDFPFSGPPSSHTHSISDSTTVPDATVTPDNTGINAGHLANLASLSSSQTLIEAFDNADISIDAAEPGSIMIPVGTDDPAEGYWNFPTNPPTTGSEQAGQYAWLQ